MTETPLMEDESPDVSKPWLAAVHRQIEPQPRYVAHRTRVRPFTVGIVDTELRSPKTIDPKERRAGCRRQTRACGRPSVRTFRRVGALGDGTVA